MAMNSPKVKVTFDADLDGLKRGTQEAEAHVSTFGDKVTDFGKKAAAAFAVAAAAAAAYAGRLAIDGVKAAIEDEKSQTQLRLALEKTTDATAKQTKAVEDSILKMELATGVTDDKLRPAMARLLRSTEDITKAQQLLALAVDISTATGKPLEAVSNALGKAFDGQTTALGKLGLGLSAAELKNASFSDVQKKLTDLFGGAAAANAETYAGKMARVSVAFDEAKETLGYKLLPILQNFFDFVNQKALPVLNAFSEGFSLSSEKGFGKILSTVGGIITNVLSPAISGLWKGLQTIGSAIADHADTFKRFGDLIKTYVAPVIGEVLGGAFQVVGKIASGVITVIASVLNGISSMVEGAIKSINWLIEKYNSIPFLPNIPTIPTAGVPKVTVPTVTAPTVPTVGGGSITTGGTGGGSTSSGASGAASTIAGAVKTTGYTSNEDLTGFLQYRAGEQNTNLPTAYQSYRAGEQGTTVNATINIGVAGDPVSTANTIVDLLNQSTYRGGGGSSALVMA